MEDFLGGAIAVASLIVGLFFARFWHSTRDRFFLLFALSFWIDSAHRVALFVLFDPDATSATHYLPRLVAYGLIIAAIVDKNRKA
jgi:hypothetical protein